MSNAKQIILNKHLNQIQNCRSCSLVEHPAVAAHPSYSKVMLVLPPPSEEEYSNNRRISGPLGNALLRWFSTIGLMDDEAVRRRLFVASMCRCFCGRDAKNELRSPSRQELDTCRKWMLREMMILEPSLVIPVGRLAIAEFLPPDSRETAVGGLYSVNWHKQCLDVVPLPEKTPEAPVEDSDPHLKKALYLIQTHPAFEQLL